MSISLPEPDPLVDYPKAEGGLPVVDSLPTAGTPGKNVILAGSGISAIDSGAQWHQDGLPQLDPATLDPAEWSGWLVPWQGRLYFSTGLAWKQIA